MVSRIVALARPVRTEESSLRKSSTAFSMRVLACARTSLLVFIREKPSGNFARLLRGAVRHVSHLRRSFSFALTQTLGAGLLFCRAYGADLAAIARSIP